MNIKVEFFDMYSQIGILIEPDERHPDFKRFCFRLELPKETQNTLWQITHGHAREDD